MNILRKYALPFIVIIIVLFFASSPYNKYCIKTDSCTPISMKTVFPKKQGLGFNVEFATTNHHELLQFRILSKETIGAHTNETIVIVFEVTNNYNKIIYFRPKLEVTPKQFNKYIERYQCLCMEEQSVKAKETKRLKMVFAITDEIENEELFIKKYFDQELMDDQSSNGNHFPLNIKMRYVIENTY